MPSTPEKVRVREVAVALTLQHITTVNAKAVVQAADVIAQYIEAGNLPQ